MRHNFVTFIPFLLLVLLLPSAVPDIASDRAALLAFRSAVGGRVLLWNLSSPTPCAWSGVECSADNSAVTALHFPGMGLSGPIPPNTISNLTNLITLSLRFNSLSGLVPSDFFASLTSLRNVYLQHNFFTGQIPDSLFSLANLVRLNMADNRFSGPISVSFNNLTRLGTLFLQGNQLSGSIPDLNLPGLGQNQFNVSNNNLTGEIPRGLATYPRNSFLGNSLCGGPLDSCNPNDPSINPTRNGGKKNKLSGGAIAGIIIGSIIGFFLIMLLLFCLCRVCVKKQGRSKDEVRSVEKEIEVAIPREKTVMESNANSSSSVAAVEKKDAVSGNKKTLVFFGNTGWRFDLDDLLKASAEVLGKGTFGTAYKAVVEGGIAVVVKKLRDVTMPENEFKQKMEEIGRFDHENLVPLRGYYSGREEKLLVFDYLPMGSLSALLHGNKGAGRTPLNWETRSTIALGAARGISYLHSQGPKVSHGSIKSSNILLSNKYEARVSDFGLAQLAGPTTTPNRIAGYRAPEVTDLHRVSQKADVYSFGVFLLELLTGKAPTQSLTNEEGVDLPRWVQSVVREEWTSEVFDLELLRYQNVEEDMVLLLQLAVDCTQQYPDKRPLMSDVVGRIEEICRSNNQSGDIVNIESSSSPSI